MHRRTVLGVAAAAATGTLYGRLVQDPGYGSALSRRYDAWWRVTDAPPSGVDPFLDTVQKQGEEVYAARSEPRVDTGRITYRFALHRQARGPAVATATRSRDRASTVSDVLDRCAAERWTEDSLAEDVLEGDLL